MEGDHQRNRFIVETVYGNANVKSIKVTYEYKPL